MTVANLLEDHTPDLTTINVTQRLAQAAATFTPYKVSLANGASALVTVAGIWTPTGATQAGTHLGIPVATSMYSEILLPNGRNGLVMNGWAYDSSSNAVHLQVSAAVFEQNVDGTLTLATGKYLPDAKNEGSGSVLVADFNGDGRQDIFLAAHNETPWIAAHSTAYLSNANGGFIKVVLDDHAVAHGASLAYINGIPTVFVSRYDGDPNPTYQFINGKFVETVNPNGAPNRTDMGYKFPIFNGDSSSVADFDGDGALDIVAADVNYGPGFPFTPAPMIVVYGLSQMSSGLGGPIAVLTPYFNGKPAYAAIPGLSGPGQSHTYRVWTDDFNHDGKPDILAGTGLWPSVYSMLQMFQNTSANGAVSFVDRTDTLNADYNVKTQEVDYSMQMLDVDHSGIKTLFIAGPAFLYGSDQGATQDNYILLNDGTGKLHVYLHDQFQALSNQLAEAISPYAPTSSGGQVRFIEYLTPDNKINLVADLGIAEKVGNDYIAQELFLNIPLQLDPGVDYRENITVTDRNSSMLMRTWAGNDTFYDTGANAGPTHIDGGLGVNTAIYSGKTSDYTIGYSADGSIAVAGQSLSDTLAHIQRLKFSNGVAYAGKAADYTITHNADGSLTVKDNTLTDTWKQLDRLQFADGGLAQDMAVTQAGGRALLTLGATLGAAFTTDKGLAGAFLRFFDSGATVQTGTSLLLDIGLLGALAGGNDNPSMVKFIYTNVYGSAPDASTLATLVAPLNAHTTTQAQWIADMALSGSNQTHVQLAGVAQTGWGFV